MSKVFTRKCDCGAPTGSCHEVVTRVDEVTPLTAAEVEEALEHIRAGWTQGAIEFNNNVCSIGALNRARFGTAYISYFGTPEATNQYHDTMQEFVKLSEIPDTTLHGWNDALGRKQSEVEDAFMTVAKKLRDQGR